MRNRSSFAILPQTILIMLMLVVTSEAGARDACAEFLGAGPAPSVESAFELSNIRGLMLAIAGVAEAKTKHERNEAARETIAYANLIFDEICNLAYVLDKAGRTRDVEPAGLRVEIFQTRSLLQGMFGLRASDLKRAIALRVDGIRALDHPTDPIGYVWPKAGDPSQQGVESRMNAMVHIGRPATEPTSDLAYGREHLAEELTPTEDIVILPVGLDRVPNRPQAALGPETHVALGFARVKPAFVDDTFDLAIYLDVGAGVFGVMPFPK